MPSAKDTDLNLGAQGQVVTSDQKSCTAGSPHQASTVASSTVSWHQTNRPWKGQHKSTGSGSETKIAQDMDPSKILDLSLVPCS